MDDEVRIHTFEITSFWTKRIRKLDKQIMPCIYSPSHVQLIIADNKLCDARLMHVLFCTGRVSPPLGFGSWLVNYDKMHHLSSNDESGCTLRQSRVAQIWRSCHLVLAPSRIREVVPS
jgi:hypothetical protein